MLNFIFNINRITSLNRTGAPFACGIYLLARARMFRSANANS